MDPLSGKPHYPYPSGPIKGQPTVNPRRRLAPLLIPTSMIPLPTPLPKDLTRKCAFTSTHTLSVHIFPAAFPRAASSQGKLIAPPMEGQNAKEDRKKWLKQTVETILWEKAEAEKVFPDPKAGIKAGEIGLWSTVSRIRRNKSVEAGMKGITLVAMHSNGFHIEVWEPVFRHLLGITETSSSPVRIEEIWSLEMVNHGDAGLINSMHIPKIPDGSDHGRDLANFLAYHLPEAQESFGEDIPFQLTRLPPPLSNERVKNGFADRKVVALGHSLGGGATALCGISYPKLFSALILLEPTFFPSFNNNLKSGPAIIMGVLERKSSWPSKEEARKTFHKTPLFKGFDPAVLEAYLQYGLYKDEKTGEVHLKCNPAWEATQFTERRAMNEGWELLPTIDEKIALRWIMGGREDSSHLVGGAEVAQQAVWRRPANSSNVRIPGGGHLIVQEKPTEIAEDVALFLAHTFTLTKKGEERSKL